MMNRPALFLSLSLAALFSAGCAGYRLGPTNGETARSKSVQVNFFQNQTGEPRLVEAVNSSLRKRLQQDGTYRLDTRGQGDVILNGVLTRFDRAGISYQPGDIVTVRDYNLSITAKITATERGSGRVIFEKLITGKSIIRVGADLGSGERQAVPLIADDLAKNTASLLVDGAW